jgi:demethylmenaquinone methyltransferase/2-methoxy-6-polyprenyl-1,4-benzoquinol methylase
MTTTAPRAGSGEMFDRIAPRYDLLNRINSFGLDILWRRALIKSLQCSGDDEILDVATGTADVAIALAKYYKECRVEGLDPSANMLAVGREKIEKAALSPRVTLVQGDGQALPYEDSRFAAACISFGIRNVPDRLRCLQEMRRVVRPGGVVAVLELGEPEKGFFAPLARFHVHHIVPRLGALVSSPEEYRYLQTSIQAFPNPEAFLGMMQEAGLEGLAHESFAFGATNLFTGKVPQ